MTTIHAAIKAAIKATLEANNGCCLDDARDRSRVLPELCKAVYAVLEARPVAERLALARPPRAKRSQGEALLSYQLVDAFEADEKTPIDVMAHATMAEMVYGRGR